jgi:hypothetical protein
MEWLITYECLQGTVVLRKGFQNATITERPETWLQKMRKKHPNDHYVLLFALKIEEKNRSRKSTGAGKKRRHRSGPDDSQGIHF